MRIESHSTGTGAAAVPFSQGVLVSAIGLFTIALAIWIGITARFIGLDTLTLAVDEYYFARGVDLIAQHGVPRFATGGYYMHGPLAQYLTAASVLVFGPTGFAYRLPAALFSLLSVILLYVYSRRFLERIPAGILCAALLVSSWHVEFARFARMYSALQCLTLLFFIMFDKVVFQEGWHRRYWLHLIVFLTTLTHSLGLFLVGFLFVPLFLIEKRHYFSSRAHVYRYAAVTVVLLVFCIWYNRFDFLRLGVSNPFPEGYARPEFRFFLRLPVFPFWGIDDSAWNLAFFIGVFALIAAILTAWRHFDGRLSETDLIVALLLVSVMFHMFVPAGALFFLLVFRHRIHRTKEHPLRSYILLLASFIVVGFWIIHAVISRHWLVSLPVAEGGLFKVLGRAFFGWPDFYGPVFVPWVRELPVIGLAAIVAVSYQITSKVREPLTVLLRNPACVVCYIVVCLAIFNHSPSTRYAFFIYPFILLTMALTTLEVFSRLARCLVEDRSSIQSFAMLCFLALFLCTDDFHVRHITHVASQNVRFRLAEFRAHARSWYARSDYESPAKFAAALADQDPAIRIVVVGLPPVSYYLGRSHAMYYDRNGRRFYNVSRVGGTVELWSNQKLLSTEQELRAYTESSKRALLIKPRSPEDDEAPFPTEQVWNSLGATAKRVFMSIDNRIEVVLVTTG